MKKIPIICVAAMFAAITASHGALELDPIGCNTSRACATTALPCCCPTGETQTTNTCPLGWTYSASTGLCSRSGSTTGSDDIGYYTTTYGTCSPTTTTSACYKAVSRAAAGNDCLCLAE